MYRLRKKKCDRIFYQLCWLPSSFILVWILTGKRLTLIKLLGSPQVRCKNYPRWYVYAQTPTKVEGEVIVEIAHTTPRKLTRRKWGYLWAPYTRYGDVLQISGGFLAGRCNFPYISTLCQKFQIAIIFNQLHNFTYVGYGWGEHFHQIWRLDECELFTF